jgi:FixJ family two-component response regulator
MRTRPGIERKPRNYWREKQKKTCGNTIARQPLSYRVPLPEVQSADEWANRMRTIAVIDDNPSMLKGLSRLLSAHGFEVQTYSSAELFLECLAECNVDCLLLDIHLGGISGIDLQRRLTSLGSDLPVIFMTAIDNPATRQEAFDAGCIAYLRKPFLANLLIDAINRVPFNRVP